MKKQTDPPIIMRHPKPVVPRGLVIAFSFALTFIILYVALYSAIHTPSLYKHQTTTDTRDANARVIAYIDSPIFSLNTLHFLSNSEQSHMTDVKRFFDIAFIVELMCIGFLAAVVGVFAYNKMWHRFDELLGRSLRASGWTLLSICLVFGLASMINFDKLWLIIHAVLFPQGNWMFPVDSVLITLYPAEFFSTLVIRWLFMLLATGVVAVALSHIMQEMRKHEAHFAEDFERRQKKK